MPQVSCRPLRIQFTLKNPFIFATMATWGQAFNRTEAEQRALYASEGFRTQWKEEMERRRIFRGQWRRITVRDAAGADSAARYRENPWRRSRRRAARTPPTPSWTSRSPTGSRPCSTSR